METLFNNRDLASPKLSIVLVDWSCRESFHVLDYLRDQTVPREHYEVIWIEYYDRRAGEIDKRLKECTLAGKHPIVDRWVTLGVPRDVYYHKHLMYNAGIILSRGKIVAICDSDAIVKDTIVSTIIEAFEQDSEIVLHLDEVRNNERRFYPFNYPLIDEVIGEGAVNWRDGKTTGLWDTEDVLHSRNYGAFMAALRKDLIQIGGADEHIDYLGHICGPYEMTFRLVNLGKREFWHQKEFLYHVWHPGQAGENNYVGPHDGRHMSSRALLVKLTGQILPFQENAAIQNLRLNGNQVELEGSFVTITSAERLSTWSAANVSKLEPKLWQALFPSRRPGVVLYLLKSVVKTGFKEIKAKALQFRVRRAAVPSLAGGVKSTIHLNRTSKNHLNVFNVIRTWRFIRRVLESHLYAVQCSKRCLESIIAEGKTDVSLYGTGELAEILYALTFDTSIRLKHIYDDLEGEYFHEFKILPVEKSTRGEEKVIVATFMGTAERIARLRRLGIPPERIIALQ